MTDYSIYKFPKTRTATVDICAIGKRKHHVTAIIEVDVTESRVKLKKYKRFTNRVSFTAWLVSVISQTIKDYEYVAAYLKGKRKAIIFNDINVSIIVEKTLDGKKVPIPLIIEKASEKSIETITKQINDAREKLLTDDDVVLHKRSGRIERFYYIIPGFIRRFFWKFLLAHPHLAFAKMGNVAITSLGMMGNVNGWFIPISIHPICFGISKLIKKPVVIDNKIEIREILKMTVLLDHNVVDGAPMARFISNLSENIEKGLGLTAGYDYLENT